MDELYYNNYKKHSFQVELWEECDNRCQFCYLAQEGFKTLDTRKLEALNDLKNKLDNFDFDTYNNISLIGGEFFQGQLTTEEIKTKFFDCLLQIGDFYKQKKIGSCWLTVTLTKGEQKELYELLDIFDKNKMFIPVKKYGSSGLWLCTSWDAKGRFHTEEYKKTWEYHMKNIHKKYPWVKLNTTIILTEPFIDLVNNGEFNFNDFKKDFNTELFFKQSGLGNRFSISKYLNLEQKHTTKEIKEAYYKCKEDSNKWYKWNFFPDRNKFIQFLSIVKQKFPNDYIKLFNLDFRADSFIRNFNTSKSQKEFIRDKKNNKETGDTDNFEDICGHSIYYNCYKNDPKGHCCLCDKKMIEEMI